MRLDQSFENVAPAPAPSAAAYVPDTLLGRTPPRFDMLLSDAFTTVGQEQTQFQFDWWSWSASKPTSSFHLRKWLNLSGADPPESATAVQYAVNVTATLVVLIPVVMLLSFCLNAFLLKFFRWVRSLFGGKTRGSDNEDRPRTPPRSAQDFLRNLARNASNEEPSPAEDDGMDEDDDEYDDINAGTTTSGTDRDPRPYSSLSLGSSSSVGPSVSQTLMGGIMGRQPSTSSDEDERDSATDYGTLIDFSRSASPASLINTSAAAQFLGRGRLISTSACDPDEESGTEVDEENHRSDESSVSGEVFDEVEENWEPEQEQLPAGNDDNFDENDYVGEHQLAAGGDYFNDHKYFWPTADSAEDPWTPGRPSAKANAQKATNSTTTRFPPATSTALSSSPRSSSPMSVEQDHEAMAYSCSSSKESSRAGTTSTSADSPLEQLRESLTKIFPIFTPPSSAGAEATLTSSAEGCFAARGDHDQTHQLQRPPMFPMMAPSHQPLHGRSGALHLSTSCLSPPAVTSKRATVQARLEDGEESPRSGSTLQKSGGGEKPRLLHGALSPPAGDKFPSPQTLRL
mmetsp:Transcript_10559/g.25746  ORF Transcript_10559/g.25746 Transcript_10559/m.25746 type:complete len:571 (+) Transcript_10559:963-2675(+)